jgi:hypothetical protein
MYQPHLWNVKMKYCRERRGVFCIIWSIVWQLPWRLWVGKGRLGDIFVTWNGSSWLEIMGSVWNYGVKFSCRSLGWSSSKIPPPLTLALNTLHVVMHILLCEVNATHISYLLLQHLCWILWMHWGAYCCVRSLWNILAFFSLDN